MGTYTPVEDNKSGKYTPQSIVKGDDLMLFDSEGHSIAYATSHTLTLSGDTTEISTKDHGIYKGYEVSKIDWEITSENLYTEGEYDSLFASMMNRKAVTIYFGTFHEDNKNGTVANGDYEYWTGKKGYTGTAYITSLVANANTGENATMSITLKGSGKIQAIADIDPKAAHNHEWRADE